MAGGRAVCVGAFMGQLDASIVTVALPDLAAGLPGQHRRGHLGGPELPAGPGSYGDSSRAVRRHVGPQAALRVRVRRLHDRLGALRPGPRPGRAAGFGSCRRWARRCCRPTASPSSCWPCQGSPAARRSGSRARPRLSGLSSARPSGAWSSRPGGGGGLSAVSAMSPGWPSRGLARPRDAWHAAIRSSGTIRRPWSPQARTPCPAPTCWVTSGGVSMGGEHDVVRTALQTLESRRPTPTPGSAMSRT